MKILYRILGGTVAVFFIVLFASSTFLVLKKLISGKSQDRQQHVAVLDVSGVIYSSTKVLKELDDILKHPGAKAIVARINSPGGLVAPSEEIYEALKEADKKIPVIISMASLAASGGYYAALGGRKIFANPGTLTASIGVIMEFMNTERLYQWAKVERFSLTAGKLKDAGSPLRPMKPEEKAYFTALLNDIHKNFKAKVKERRKLNDEEVDAITDGRVMSGTQAKQAKLVDEIGTVNDAIREAKKLANLKDDADVHYPHDNRGLLQRVLLGDDEEEERTSLSGLLSRLAAPPVTHGWQVMLLMP